MSVLMGDRWIEAPKGSFVLAPGGVMHDFENRSSGRAGVLNFSIRRFREDHAGDRAALPEGIGNRHRGESQK